MRHIQSKIFLREVKDNTQPAPNADFVYYPAYVISNAGEQIPALFTFEAIEAAVARAKAQPEDVPPLRAQSFWDWLCNWAEGVSKNNA